MERETGIEPATSSLGIFTSIEYKGQRRPPACMQIQAKQQLLPHLPLIGGSLEGAPPSPFVLIKAPSGALLSSHDLGEIELHSRQLQALPLPDFNFRIALLSSDHRADPINDLAISRSRGFRWFP